MAKEPYRFQLEIGEWLLLTTLVSESPTDFQIPAQKDTDVYDMDKLTQGCAKLVFEDSPTQRKYCVSLVAKFKTYLEDGYTCVEFKPFDDQESSSSGS